MTSLKFLIILGVYLFNNPNFVNSLSGASKSSPIEQFPYQAAIENKGKFQCSAAIISVKFVILTSTCVKIEKGETSKLSDLRVRAGISTREKDGSLHDVKGYYTPKANVVFRKEDRLPEAVKLTDHLALIKVKKNFIYEDYTLQKATPLLDWSTFKDGVIVQISGWNFDKKPNCDSPLQAIYASLLTRDKCSQNYNTIIHNNSLCTDLKNLDEKDAYEADLGDLVTINGYLFGIVFENGVCSKTLQPVIFATVASFFNSTHNTNLLEDK